MAQSIPFSASGGGNHVIIPAVAGQVIVVYCMFFQCSALSTVTIKSNTLTFTGPMQFLLGGGFELPAFTFNFTTAPGEDLILGLAGLTGGVAGAILYDQM